MAGSIARWIDCDRSGPRGLRQMRRVTLTDQPRKAAAPPNMVPASQIGRCLSKTAADRHEPGSRGRATYFSILLCNCQKRTVRWAVSSDSLR
jgi:hypothetical protein